MIFIDFFTRFCVRLSFYGWLIFLLLLVAVGFYPFFVMHGVDVMLLAMRSAGFSSAVVYSFQVAVAAFVISFILAFLFTMTISQKKWAIIFANGCCFFWLAVPPLSLLAGMDIFYGMVSNFFPNPNGIHHILALVQKEVPFLLLVMLNARTTISKNYRHHAISLGFDGVAKFFKIEFPLIWPKVKWPCALILLFAFNNVEMGIFLGPSAPPSFPILLLNSLQTQATLEDDVIHGFACWLLLMNISLLVIFLLVEWLIKQTKVFWLRVKITTRSFYPLYYIGFGGFMLHGFLLLLTVAVAVVATLAIGRGLGSGLIYGMVNSLWLGMIASVSAVFVFLWWRFYRIISGWQKYILLLPIFLPDIILAFHGQLLAFFLGGQWLLLLFLIHGGIGMALAMLMLDGAYDKIPHDMIRHAKSLGLKPMVIFWRVVVPLLWRPMLFAIALCFAVSISLYIPNLILARGFDTMTTLLVAYQFSGDDGLVAVVSLWLLLLPMLGYGIAYYLSGFYDRKFG
ncbi:MAG: hypothetical protein ACR2NY_04345 [Alphaproteobacteria bacterium]